MFGLTFQRKQPSEELRAYSVAFHAINVKFHTPFRAEDTHFKAQVLRLSSRTHYPPDLMSETQRRTRGKHTERIPAAAAKLLPRRNPAQLHGGSASVSLLKDTGEVDTSEDTQRQRENTHKHRNAVAPGRKNSKCVAFLWFQQTRPSIMTSRGERRREGERD